MKDDELADNASSGAGNSWCREMHPRAQDGPEFQAGNCDYFQCYRLRTATAKKGFVKGSISVPQGSKTSL